MARGKMTDKKQIEFSPSDRVLVVVPHPDDEVVGTGGLLLRARSASASVKVYCLTDGDNDPLPQMMDERKFIIRRKDKSRWGKRRRDEALKSLSILGVTEEDATFMGVPDQAIHPLSMAGDFSRFEALRLAFSEYRPTHLVIPSPLDTHPDHNSFLFIYENLLRPLCEAMGTSTLYYLVHPYRYEHSMEPFELVLTEDEKHKKREALLSHTSQFAFGKRRMLRFLRASEHYHDESFLSSSSRPGWIAGHRDSSNIILTVKTPLLFNLFNTASLLLADKTSPTPLLMKIPFHLFSLSNREHSVLISQRVPGKSFTFCIPGSQIDPKASLLFKLENRVILYDFTGWARFE